MITDSDAGRTDVVKRRILIVDDEPGILKGCDRVLTALGHEVLTTERAERGLAIIRENPDLDLVLVDLRMPGMDGLDLLAAAREVAPETVFVIITAYATIEAAVAATKRGAYDFLAKPFSPDELTRLVERSLERAQLIRERNHLAAERRRRMLELTTEQSRLRTIIDCMAEGVLVSNAEGELVLCNPAALKVLNRDFPGETPAGVPETVAYAELSAMIQETAQSARRVSREMKLQTAGREEWILADVAPVTDETSGQFLGTVSVLRDITELKRVEQVKAQFVNMVAHELRAPLAAVDGYLAVMLGGLVDDPHKQHDMLDRSKQRLAALLDLVGDLLDVARIEAGAVRREIVPVNIAEVLTEVAELARPLAEKSAITIAVRLPDKLPPVEADREELNRLFSNLVSNATKYNRRGGSVTLAAEPDGPYVQVAVTDTGVGISPEGVKRLFSEFFREKTSATKHITGTGLGLSIVKGIVDFYHGQVNVRSTPGEGSTFTVRLPCKPGALPAADVV